MYSTEPIDKKVFTEKLDQAYSRFARIYDLLVKWLPVWRRWITQVIPEIRGSRVLEVSFGTGYLMTRYAGRFETWGIDYNWDMVCTTSRNLQQSGLEAKIQQSDVERLPYRSSTFDTVINTMAFSGYPDGQQAMAELYRILKPSGRLVMIDINYPRDNNPIGKRLVRGWMALGDLIRDMSQLFDDAGFRYTEREVGGFGSVHLYVAMKKLHVETE